MNIYTLYFLAGSLGGFFGGLLGLGGGIIFVPFLFFIFNQYGIHSSHIMQSAICTSLACIVISSLSSTYKHNKNKLIDWDLFKKIRDKHSLILSGALNINNLEHATKNSNVKFVDVSSSLETKPGKKSIKKINRFLELATKL